jgi:hypothetical protein
MTVDDWIRDFVEEWKKRIADCKLEVSSRVSSRTHYKILINEESYLYIEHLEFINRNRFRLFILIGDLPIFPIIDHDFEEFEGYVMESIFSDIRKAVENMVRKEVYQYNKEFLFDDCMYMFSEI